MSENIVLTLDSCVYRAPKGLPCCFFLLDDYISSPLAGFCLSAPPVFKKKATIQWVRDIL